MLVEQQEKVSISIEEVAQATTGIVIVFNRVQKTIGKLEYCEYADEADQSSGFTWWHLGFSKALYPIDTNNVIFDFDNNYWPTIEAAIEAAQDNFLEVHYFRSLRDLAEFLEKNGVSL
jgi:hypothetical protein